MNYSALLLISHGKKETLSEVCFGKIREQLFDRRGAMRLCRRLFSSAPSEVVPKSVVSQESQLQMMQLHKGGSADVRVVLEGYYDDGFEVFGKRCAGPIAVLPDLVKDEEKAFFFSLSFCLLSLSKRLFSGSMSRHTPTLLWRA